MPRSSWQRETEPQDHDTGDGRLEHRAAPAACRERSLKKGGRVLEDEPGQEPEKDPAGAGMGMAEEMRDERLGGHERAGECEGRGE